MQVCYTAEALLQDSCTKLLMYDKVYDKIYDDISLNWLSIHKNKP